MSTPALQMMARHLTIPFARGASTLILTLGAGSDATSAQIASYDFLEYSALFNAQPKPRYILIALQDVLQATQVTIDYQGTSASGSTVIAVPEGTLAGASFALDLNGHEEPDIRLQRVHMVPAPPPGQQVFNLWSIQALLGNLAKLFWVIGWEKDNIRRNLEIIQTQRHLPKEVRYSLDLLGYDLGIPRFPPQPYSFDAATIALYHLNDLPASGQTEVIQVEDSTVHYTQVSHPGQNTSGLAKSGAVGRFGTAFTFASTNAEIQIPDHPDFNLGAQGNFTLECFVKPDPATPDGEVLTKHPNPVANTKSAGWALSVGNFQRGLPFNVRFLLSDGVIQQPILLFADISLSSDHFYHLAGIIDRGTNEARLYVDGNLVSKQSISALGALTNTEPLRIGRSPVAAYQGVIDEVRISRVARTSFHPVLGEDDEVYRRRLELFGHWTLPTVSNLQKMLNDAVSNIEGGINGDPQPIILNETNAAMAGSTVEFTVQPNTVAAGLCIDTQGERNVQEADVNGTAVAELTFDPVYLIVHNDPRVIYAPSPARVLTRGELPPDASKMQLVTTQPLNQLLNLLGTSGKLLTILSAFDPRADDLRAVGRGLLLAPTTIALSLDKLAAQAHRAGFSFVCNRNDLRAVYVSTGPGDYLEIIVNPGGTAQNANGFTLHVGETLNLGIQPSLPSDTLYRWITLPSNQGTFAPASDRASVTFTAGATGLLNLKVDAIRRQSVASGTIAFRVGPTDLADGASIGDDGTQNVGENIAGTPGDSFFHPAYLLTHNDARVAYGNDVNTRRMQPSVAQRLDQLLSLLPASTAGSQLQIVQAYTPGASDLSQVGRALTIQHPTVPPGSLGVMAYAAGFTYVRRQNNQILLRHRADDLVSIQRVTGGQPTPITGPQEIMERQSISLAARPRATPHGIAVGPNFIYVSNSGTDTVSEIDPTTGLVRRAMKVGWGPGAVVLSPDGTRLYTADSLGSTVTALDVASGNIVKIIPARPNPVALAHNPTTQRLYVACQSDNSLLEIDTGALSVLNTPLAVGASPTGLALTPDGKAIWVALNGANQINIVGTTSPIASIGNVALTKAPLKIAISPDGTRAYVTQPLDGSVAILNITNRTVVMTASIGAVGTSNPNAIAVAPDNSAIYVTDATIKNEHLLLLKPVDGSIIATIRVQQEPLDVAGAVMSIDVNTAKQQYVMVVSRGGDVVSVIDPLKTLVANTWRIGSGLGEALSWILRMPPITRAHLSSSSAPVVNLTGDSAGPGLVRAVYAQRNDPNNTAPYTFDVRLKPALEGSSTTIIRKEQYDLIMNILNAFHPIGVEVTTRIIRDRVIEVKGQLRNAFPDYTYPNFRVRGPLPQRTRKD